MIDLIDRSEVLQKLCAACSNMGSFACMSCTIPGIVKRKIDLCLIDFLAYSKI